MKKPFRALAVLSLALSFSCAVPAQPSTSDHYPSKQVRIIVPFAPGGATDYIARLMAQKLAQRLGQSFVVENRAGAGGIIAIQDALRAPPDGYTLLVASASYAVNPAMMKLPFDPVRDAQPVINMALGALAFIVHPSLPVKTLADLVAYTRANPGKLTFASAGVGNTTDIGMEAFLASTKIRMIHSPYKGMAPALEAVAGNYAQVILSDVGSAQGLVSAGRLRMIAVGGNTRLAQFPRVPTVAEAGYPNVMAGSWQGMFAPAGTPAPIVARLNTEINAILRTKEVEDLLAARYAAPVGGTPAQFAETVRSDIEKFKAVARGAGIQMQQQ